MLRIEEELLESTARTIAALPANEVERALGKAASDYARALCKQRPELSGAEVGCKSRHFARQVAHRVRAIVAKTQ